MLIDGDTIAWIGEDTAAEVHREAADVVVDLAGAFVAPGFVDAHVHATSTGLAADGLDLASATSADSVLAEVRAYVRTMPAGVVLGHGWDETTWTDPRVPSRQEIDAAADGRPVYLSRIDVHSALVSTAIIEACPGVDSLPGWSTGGALSRQAHHRVRDHALASVTPAQRTQAQRALRRIAAEQGIVALHEMAGPSISSVEDLDALLSLADNEPGPLVAGYWGQLAEQGGLDLARELGAVGAGGDLFIDGAIGSRTACLHEPYSDDPQSTGTDFVDVDQVCRHVVAATQAGMQAGFHVIGDAACSVVTAGMRRAAAQLGTPAIRAVGHRIEHAEMLGDDDIAALVEFGVTASMQPMFDALWGHQGGMYEQRLGGARSTCMNRFADIVGAGGRIAFSSDAPVTDIGPWAAVRAAMHHSNPRQSISARAAFSAHTRGGWRAVGESGVGVLAPGAPAHLAIWDTDVLDVQTPDARISGWSTDPRSGTPGLPVLTPESELPACLTTVVSGKVVHSTGECSWS
jgi:predicted amidohydrolase YtcJ